MTHKVVRKTQITYALDKEVAREEFLSIWHNCDFFMPEHCSKQSWMERALED